MNKNYLVYLHSIGFSQKNLFDLFWLSSNIDYKDFFLNLQKRLKDLDIIDEKQKQKILFNLKNLNQNELDDILFRKNISIVSIFDKNYPENLKHIKRPPFFLYVRWNLNWDDNFFRVIWSRKITNYWKKVWEYIIPDLVKYFTIVSGWAWWCDTLAHKLTLENNWKTVVVFWTWIDVTYPKLNYNLFEKIVENNWALISIFPLKTQGNVYTFPIRNEIVAWISKWILVLEASEKSWTLITSNLALDQWKDLFAVPADIFNKSSYWTNTLIKNWEAKLVLSSDDILQEYNYKIIKKEVNLVFENDIQKDIYNLLKFNLSLSIDEFMEKTNYSYSDLSLNLSMMELSSIIKKDMFWKYSI